MLKRLIEVALPLKEVSEHSAREKSIRHGHISTLHIWWARRPLAACRAVVFASLIPDPDDPECPEEFRRLVMDVLSKRQFQPSNGDGSSIEDTPRNRCLEFIKYLVQWENSNNPDYIEPARRLIADAHKFLHPDAEGDTPKVLDPFAGGGSIPLEALRLGCEAHAIDLNPVAHLIELCTLVYPQKYGQPDSRPVPDYIERLSANNRVKRKTKGEKGLFDKDEAAVRTEDETIPDVEITEVEYRKNPLAADVKYWGHWVLEKARREIGHLYPADPDGGEAIGYLWARTVKCPNPTCGATIPLLRQVSLCKQRNRNVELAIVLDNRNKVCSFEVVDTKRQAEDASSPTMQRGDATCPFCEQVAPVKYLREECRKGRMGDQMTCVVTVKDGQQGKNYRSVTNSDAKQYDASRRTLEHWMTQNGESIVPQEALPPVGTLGFRVNNYGFLRWEQLFNARQKMSLSCLVRLVHSAHHEIATVHDTNYSHAISAYLSLAVSRFADFCSTLCTLNNVGGRGVAHTFVRQALQMVWDYAETNPFSPTGANWEASVAAASQTISKIPAGNHAVVSRGSALSIPLEAQCVHVTITDPPYYDAIPYADLSDYFYVWLKKSTGFLFPELFRTPLTPKRQELVMHECATHSGAFKSADDYEKAMTAAFSEICRVLVQYGTCGVMFAHKTTSAWEALIAGLLAAGLTVTASWPFHTERPGRIRAMRSAALASSVTLVCRKRLDNASEGLWDDVRQELRQVVQERLDFFWNQGIRGADFFISAIGPALSVFGKYERVTKLSGEEVTVGQFLDEVRSLVTNYALTKILRTAHTAAIDPESRFYVVWQWSYGDAKVPADESFKLSQALGMHTEEMWDRTGVLEKAGENVQAVPISKRMKLTNLGEPTANGAPACLIDVLHRLCAFREKGDTQGMAQFLGQSGHTNNPTLWLVAQAISEILPDGDKEKQLMQGLLNQRESLEEATRQRGLF